MPERAPVAVFDMNETTLDLGPVRDLVDDLLGPAGGFTVWFQKLLQLSMAATATGQPFAEFGTMARHAFASVGAAGMRDDAPGDEAFAPVGAAMGDLRPYPEVPEAMDRLRASGWMTMALTNSTQAMVEAQCANSGLTDRFDHIVSVEQVQIYKPAPAPYRHAAEVAGRPIEDMWMVACHDWDLAGAGAAGMRTAFVERPRMSWADLYPRPDLVAADFTDMVDQLLA